MKRLLRVLTIRAAVLTVLCVVTCRAEAASPSAVERPVEIDRVELNGVKLLTQADIEGVLEVSPGDVLERLKVVHSAENLQALYRSRGYEQVSIRSVLLRKKIGRGFEEVLEFNIQEGLPTRVAGVQFTPQDKGDREKIWEDTRSSLLAKVGLAPGDLLDQEKLTLSRKGMQDVLASREFVGAKVGDAKISTVPAPAPAVPNSKDVPTAGRWVKLEFQVHLGDRVSFGFQGNTVFTTSHLAGLVEEQRVLGFGNDYVVTIRNRIEEEYRGLGYSQIKAEPFNFEVPARQERHLTYQIHEGPRTRIESVNFDGNLVFTGEELRTQFMENASVILRNGYYYEKDVQKAAELVVEWMKTKGYISAKLVTVNTVLLPKVRRTDEERRVRLIIYVYESEQTVVQSISLKGLRAFTDVEAKKILGVQEGAPLNLFAFNEGVDALKASYRAKGYLGASIRNEGTEQVVLYSQENNFADIVLEIVEGPQYRVSRIIIEGRTFTEERVISREIPFKDGDILKEPEMLDTESRLRRLGIFATASLRATDDPEREGYKVIRITVQEGTPGVIGGGAGFRNDLGIRGFGEFAYTNLWGQNHVFSAQLKANRRLTPFTVAPSLLVPNPPVRPPFIEYQGQLAYTWPWFGVDRLNFRPRFTVEHTQYLLFNAFVVGAGATWEKKFLSKPDLIGSFTYNLERVNQSEAIYTVDSADQTLGSVTAALRVDLRDNALSPTKGLFATGSFEFAAPWLFSRGGDALGNNYGIGYTRFQVRADYSIPLARGIVGFVSFRSGFVRNTELPIAGVPSSGTVPLIKQFTLGGVGSLRGFGEQELNSQTIQIQGTQSYVNYRFQLDLPFSGGLRFAPFLDAGNLQVDNYSFGNLHYGTGFGFHYVTPVGPVNFDLGFKLFPRPGEDVGPFFYFSIGVI